MGVDFGWSEADRADLAAGWAPKRVTRRSDFLTATAFSRRMVVVWEKRPKASDLRRVC